MGDVSKEDVLKFLVESMVRESPDSLDIGTAGKGGAIKIYGNFERPEEFRKKIDSALELRKYTNKALEQGTGD